MLKKAIWWLAVGLLIIAGLAGCGNGSGTNNHTGYVTLSGTNRVTGFHINGDSGKLSGVEGGPFLTGQSPSSRRGPPSQ